MNRSEVKNLLQRRNSLLELYKTLDIDYNNKSYTEDINSIYKDSRNTIGRTIYNIDKQLLRYVNNSPVGEWLLQIRGMTVDIAAGLLAYFNIKNKVCAAQFIKYTGIGNNTDSANKNIRNIINRLSIIFKSDTKNWYNRINEDKFIELIHNNQDIEIQTAHIRADRYMKKVFISHLFEEMYREEHGGILPTRYDDDSCIIIEPEVPYTK